MMVRLRYVLGIKKITIILVPGGSTKVKQFRIPKVFAVLSFLALISATAFFCWIIRDYHTLRPQIFRLAELEEENSLQKRQFLGLVQRINRLTQEIEKRQELNQRLKVMVNLKMGEDNPQFHGVGGSDSLPFKPDFSTIQTYPELVRLMHRSLDSLHDQMAVDKRDKGKLRKFFQIQKERLASTPSIWPTKGWVSSRFGYRRSPFTREREFHRGIDISSRRNTPVVASANGFVSSVGHERLPGRVVYISHGYGLVTKYAHLQKILVKEGQYVKRGQKIALVGSTGRSTGPHLHYEVHVNGVPTNPFKYIIN